MVISSFSFSTVIDKTRALRADEIKVLYDALPYSVFMNLMGVALMLVIQWTVIAPKVLLMWASAVVLVSGLRYVNYRQFLRRKDAGGIAVTWLYRNFAGVILAGFAWGSAALLLYPPENSTHQMAVVLMLSGLAAGAMTTLSVCLYVIATYLVLVLVPLMLRLYLEGGETGVILGSMVGLFFLTILLSARNFNKNITTLFRLNYERGQAQKELQLAAATFEGKEGIFITDAEGVIKKVNQMVLEITGYTEEEVLGKTPRMFSSGRHGREFYQSMWQTITTTGSWSGEIWNRRKSGEIYPQRLTVTTVKDGETVYYVGHFNDISKQKESEEIIRHHAEHDWLTDLPNRRLFKQHLHQELGRMQRKGTRGLLLFIDLDKFKPVNDLFGHHVGDTLLKRVAAGLRECLRVQDSAARLGGDEFAVLFTDLEGEGSALEQNARKLIARILDTVDKEYVIDGNKIHCAMSIGAVVLPDKDVCGDELLMRADAAMYAAKRSGRDRYCFYTSGLAH